MNMANMDHRGGIRGTVRGANNAPVANTAVTAVEVANGARFEAMTDAQGAYTFGALPVGSYNVTVVSACSGHGFKHSAGLGVALAQRLLGQAGEVDLGVFALERFGPG